MLLHQSGSLPMILNRLMRTKVRRPGCAILQRWAMVLGIMLLPFLARSQGEAAYSYILNTDAMSEVQEKQLREALADRDGLVRVEAFVPLQRLKILSDLPVPASEIEGLFSGFGVLIISMFDVSAGHYLIGGVHPDAPIAPGAKSFQHGMQGPAHEAAKQQWFVDHPNWRQEHPPTDQDSMTIE